MKPQAFDSFAPTYDSDFTNTAIGRYLRGRVQARLMRYFSAGDHVLELGCGTGEDALWLAERGVSVLATDASAAMLNVTRDKAAGHPLVQVARLDLKELPVTSYQLPEKSSQFSVLSFKNSELGTRNSELPLDGAFANFGPLNCLYDWQPLATWLAERIRPGGVAAFGVMSPLCLWEIAWHGAHGDFKTAFRRWRREGAVFQLHLPSPPTPLPQGEGSKAGEYIPMNMTRIFYPTIRRLTRDFVPYFRRVHIEPLGLFFPPSDVYGVIEKRPRWFKTLLKLEDRCGKYSQLALLADHYWIEFERTNP